MCYPKRKSASTSICDNEITYSEELAHPEYFNAWDSFALRNHLYGCIKVYFDEAIRITPKRDFWRDSNMRSLPLILLYSPVVVIAIATPPFRDGALKLTPGRPLS
jgi:hypothetical protein